jgi:hypothetical protein
VSIVREYKIGRELSDEECLKPLAVLKPKEFGDLVIRRSNVWHGNITNVPRHFKYSGWLSWGYAGVGPYDLGLNVLYHYSGEDERFARQWLHVFVAEVVQKLPIDKPMRIDGEFLKSWVETKRTRPLEESTIYGGSFEGGTFAGGHLIWDNDGNAILAPAEIA